MTSASFSFVLLASIIGMGIVFVFLTMLSLLMVMIRGLDRVAEERGAAGGAALRSAGPGALREARGVGTPASTAGLPVWAVAAVTRYLAHEAELDAERMRVSASVWTSRSARSEPRE
ncbi:MAG: OadG family protein [Spirochaetota bacterium]